MPEIARNKLVRAGGWRTLESGWNAAFSCRFQLPRGATVKIRYGDGSFLGWDSQQQTLDETFRTLNVSKAASTAYARVQMRVQQNADVSYVYIVTGP